MKERCIDLVMGFLRWIRGGLIVLGLIALYFVARVAIDGIEFSYRFSSASCGHVPKVSE